MSKYYYSLDECIDRDVITNTLEELKSDGKIYYSIDITNDILEIEDLDMDDKDIENIENIFDDYDVFPYLEGDDDDYDDDLYDDYDE